MTLLLLTRHRFKNCALVLLAQTVGVLDDVLRVVADTLQVADRADGGDEILVVELAKLAISSPKPGSNASGIYINLRFPMRRRKASHQRVGSSQWKKTMAFAIRPIR